MCLGSSFNNTTKVIFFTTATVPSYATNAGQAIQEIKAGVNFRFGAP
jgi:hypothetical protein